MNNQLFRRIKWVHDKPVPDTITELKLLTLLDLLLWSAPVEAENLTDNEAGLVACEKLENYLTPTGGSLLVEHLRELLEKDGGQLSFMLGGIYFASGDALKRHIVLEIASLLNLPTNTEDGQ